MSDRPEKPLRILFIEDNPADFELAQRTLRREGLEFIWRREEDAAGVGRALREFVPDIVISDYSLPEFDGLHALRLCKTVLPEVPFILHTAALQDESAIDSIRAGADDYVLKQHLAHLPFAVQNALERHRTREAKRAAESKLALLASAIEQSPVSVVITDTAGTIEYVNPKFIEVTGYSYEEAVGNNPRVLKSGRQPPEFYARLWNTITSGNVWTGEFENRKKNGESYWELARISPVRDAEGKITKFLAVKEDITERKLAEEAARKSSALLRTSEERLSLATNAAHIGIWDWDVEKNILTWGESMYTIYGVRKEDFAGAIEAWESTVHPDDRVFVVGELQAALRGEREYAPEFRIVRPDGEVRVIKAASETFLDADGKAVRMVGTNLDITARKQAEESLRDTKAILQAAMDNSQAGIAIADAPDGMLRYVNRAGLLIRGGSDEELMAGVDINHYVSTWQMLDLDGTPLPADEVPLAKAILQGVKCSREFIIRRKANDDRIVWANAAPIFDAVGTVKAGIVIFLDITDRKRAEELAGKHAKALERTNEELNLSVERAEELARRAEAAASAKSEFLAVMSHELRTPLNGMLGFAELLTLSRLDAEQREAVETILESGNHLLSVVNDILDFSSIEKGTKIESAPIVLADVLESLCATVRKQATAKGLSFRCETAADLPEMISGDSRRISQILLNLLGNAVKFTSQGSVVLRVTTCADPAGSAVGFSVEDTGPGIPPETLKILFQPFTQADSTLHRRFEGTGLGLAISQRLAEAMDGTIFVDSSPGKGSMFTFRLPFRASAPAVSSTPAQSVNRSTPGCCATILVVEDDEISSALATKMLSLLGHRTVLALDGQQAVAAFAKQRFSAVLMDMQMPVLDGIEATRRIRAIEAANGARVPIIAVTANVMPGDRERCLAAGMDDFLSKPYKMEELAAKLAPYLAAKA